MKTSKEQQINDCQAIFLDFKATWQFKKFMRLPHRIITLFSGNQSFKTSAACCQYVWRILGRHPVPKKNVVYFECSERNIDNKAPHGFYSFKDNDVIVKGWEKGTWNIETLPKDGKCPYCGALIIIHQRKGKKIRLCAETLPADKETLSSDGTQIAETKNTVYPELKKWMPHYLIKRDITVRNPAMIITDPLVGLELNGTRNIDGDILIDFASYGQDVQAEGGVQRMSIYCDEEPPKDHWDEHTARLTMEDGDILLGLTPANAMTWSFDSLYEKAQIYYRTPIVRDFLNDMEKTNRYKLVETTDSPSPIAVIQSSTYDNPVLSKDVINEQLESIDDPDVLATRIYGIHRQVSGRIFKDFDYKVHFLDFDRFFPDGIFREWNHYRMVDYHSHNRWACVWMSVSPENEAFVWREWNPDPEKVITAMIANEMAIMSGNYKFKFDLIDALAAETQTNTGTSTVEDLNDEFLKLKREGICTGAYWETWDSKGTRGREVVRTRLKYAKECKRPFNNKVKNHGVTRYLPTLWVSNQCVEVGRSLKQWRLQGRRRSSLNVEKDRDETPTPKWSHFCTAIECAFKDKRLRPPLIGYKSPSRVSPRYFQGARNRRCG